MSASNRSDAVRSRISFNSSYGMGLSASDHEDNWTEGDYSGMEKVDYCFAHKYFQCVTAQHLVCQEGFMVDMAEIDCRLAIMLQGYPYQTVMKQLTADVDAQPGADHGSDPCQVFQSLMVAVGRTIRIGTREKRAQLLHKLHQPLIAGMRGSPERLPHESCDSAVFTSPDQVRFASALNEYGQQQGFTPTYRYGTSATYANGCVAVVTCSDLKFRAARRNRKQARHAAAYQACLHYGVTV